MPNIRGWSLSSRPLVVVALALTLLTTPACATTTPTETERTTVLASFTVLADMAQNVAGDKIEVHSLTQPGSDVHGHEPTPKDLVAAQNTDLILANGLGLESWLTRFTDQIDAPTATISDGVTTTPIPSGQHEGSADPHAWMSPDNAHTYVDNIRDALTDLDPDNAATFEANARTYKAQITDVADFLNTELATLQESQRALVTCEGAFTYLASDAGLHERSLWPVNAGGQAAPGQVAATIRFVENHDVAAVFCESTVSDNTQHQVAQESGARVGGMLYVDSLSPPDGPAPTYLDLLRHDAETIVAGLKAQEQP